MRPSKLKSKIFLDGSDINETKEVIKLLGFLDGQTTNPSNFATSPATAERVKKGEKFDKDEVYQAYKKRVQEISQLIPQGSVSIEVYSDQHTNAEEMIDQAREFFGWIDNAHIKLPITSAGLKAAEMAVKEGIRVNMTLCFNQEQAAAVYATTKGAKRGEVFISPFIGRLYDQGQVGMDLIKNILKMYQSGDGHVEVLTSSVRTGEQFQYALAVGTDIITAYFAAIQEWVKTGMFTPQPETFNDAGLKPIVYQEIDLNKEWLEYNIKHEMTDIGLKRFADDWNALIK